MMLITTHLNFGESSEVLHNKRLYRVDSNSEFFMSCVCVPKSQKITSNRTYHTTFFFGLKYGSNSYFL
jgi:hypothetical protein